MNIARVALVTMLSGYSVALALALTTGESALMWSLILGGSLVLMGFVAMMIGALAIVMVLHEP